MSFPKIKRAKDTKEFWGELHVHNHSDFDDHSNCLCCVYYQEMRSRVEWEKKLAELLTKERESIPMKLIDLHDVVHELLRQAEEDEK